MHGRDYLKRKLENKRGRVNLRYKYYDMKNTVRDLGISTPPPLRGWFNALGWCGLAVDEIADRLVFDEFTGDDFAIGEIYKSSNQDILIPSVVKGALIGSCDFIYISQYDDGYPRMQAIDCYDATGAIDPFTSLLKEGYAVLSKDTSGNTIMDAYLTPGRTEVYEHGHRVDVVENPAEYPLLVPVIHKPDAKRPFGRSRITRACMSTVDSAIRTIKRSEISAEFFSFPQRWVTGLDRDAQKMEKWKATMSSLVTFTKDSDGKSPNLGQFTQQSMEPHMSQLKMLAAVFAGETGLTMADLGFETDTPASVEALKASHERLRRQARAAQQSFSVGFLNAGYLAACIRDNYAYKRYLVTDTEMKWMPLFETDATLLTGLGDGINKINAVVPSFFGRKNIEDITGIKAEETSNVDLSVLMETPNDTAE